MATTSTTAARALARSALAQVPRYGFTMEAIRAASPPQGGSKEGIEQLFYGSPGAETSAARRLLEAHDSASLESMAAAPFLRDSRSRDVGSKSNQKKEEEEVAFHCAVSLLETRLRQSFEVRAGLPDALASLLLSSSSSSSSTLPLLKRLPIPNPAPLLHRSATIADEALRLAAWRGNYSMDWYTTRLRLAQSFLLAEMHLLAPRNASVADEEGHERLDDESALLNPTALLRRLAYLRLPGPSSMNSQGPAIEDTLKSTKQWATWGSRGWLGIFRSVGL